MVRVTHTRSEHLNTTYHSTNSGTTNRTHLQLRPSARLTTDRHATLVNQALDYCLAKSTLNGYASSVSRFIAYCDTERIDEAQRFPTVEPVLSAYAASFLGVAAGKTAASAISALKAWHGLHNVPWQGGTRLSYVLRAVTNQAPTSSQKPKRIALDRAAINTLHSGLNMADSFDAAVYAAATVAFWGQCRLGELLGTSRTRHDPKRFPSRAALPPFAPPNAATELRLPCTKTSQIVGETIYITVQHGRADPIYALRNHFYVNKNLPPSGHLFAFRTTAGDTRCLTAEPFLNRCNAVWSDHGLKRVTGHSFRIGGTNEFLNQGVPPDVVKATGRWRSDAFLIYWRSTNAIAARHAGRIRNSTST